MKNKDIKKKKSKIEMAIIYLAIIYVAIIAIYISPLGMPSDETETETETTSNVSEVDASTQTIENTLSSSGSISSALDEKVYLHASYYFEDLLVDQNVYITEGTNIIEYTNGTYLTAPYDCVLVSYNVPNEDEICTTSHYIEIKSINTLAMSLSVSEEDINKVSIGDEVNITMTASGEVITGYITAISEVGTYSSSGSYFTATVTFNNNGNLKIGMSATCEIVIESAENVVAVPNEAIQTSDDGSYVIVVKEDGTTENVTVETGISNDAYTEIKSGITVGTTVQMEKSDSTTSNSGFNFKGGNSSDFQMPSGGGSDIQMPSGGGMSGGSMPSMPGNM